MENQKIQWLRHEMNIHGMCTCCGSTWDSDWCDCLEGPKSCHCRRCARVELQASRLHQLLSANEGPQLSHVSSCTMAAPWPWVGRQKGLQKDAQIFDAACSRNMQTNVFYVFFWSCWSIFSFLRRSFCHPRFSFFSVLDCSRMGKWRNLFWFQYLRMQSLGKFDSTSQ